MNPLFEARHLKKHFPVRRGFLRKTVKVIKAVDDISFTINRQEIVGIVGESGSGKSTTARLAMRLINPTSGEIDFLEEDFMSKKGKALANMRIEMQMVFQDPLASLNPRKTVLDNIGEALLYHKRVRNREEQAHAVIQILKQIGLGANILSHYPHQFSGGQQQRLSIGRAIALRPQLIILDEAVSALDLSVQAQILNLLYELKERLKLSYLFISHDLHVVRSICDRVLVMYQGKIVEDRETEALFEDPQHDYTKTLLGSLPTWSVSSNPSRSSKS